MFAPAFASVCVQGIFTTYTMSDKRLDTVGAEAAGTDGAAAWAAVREASTRMSRRALLQWASDYRVVPDMLLRPELLSLAKEAARA